MRVCFINPPIEDFYITSVRRQPLGLLYIMAALKKAGHEIFFINGHTPKQKIIAWPQEFGYLRHFLNEKEGFPFKNYYHFGMSYQEIARQVKAIDAEVFFVSALFTTYYAEVDEIINIIRKNKKARIVLGGYHAALYPEYYLKEKDIDFIIAGEGELSAVLLLAALDKKVSDFTDVPGLYFRSGDNIIKTEKKFIDDLDLLAFPAREYLKERDLKIYKKRAVSMIISRGCPHNCKFCSSKDFWGNRYRYRSIENIFAEIKDCILRYKTQMINFEDDNIFLKKEFAVNFLEELTALQKKEQVQLDLTAMNGVSIEGVDEEVLIKMKEAGFSELNLSLVTISADLQRTLGRPFNTDKFDKIVSLARSLAMNVRAYFILGLPEQTRDEIEYTIDYLKKLEVKIFPSIYYKINVPFKEWKAQRSSSFYNETDFLERRDLFALFNKAITVNR